jgi:hypothetical protein
MSIKLSDTQLVMLSAAAQRDDRSLTAPEKLKGGAADRRWCIPPFSTGTEKRTRGKLSPREGRLLDL